MKTVTIYTDGACSGNPGPGGCSGGAGEFVPPGKCRLWRQKGISAKQPYSRHLRGNIMKTVTIYTDGACSGNPGPGGWCAILEYNGIEKMLSGGEDTRIRN